MATAAELFQQIKKLPAAERAAFSRMFRALNSDRLAGDAASGVPVAVAPRAPRARLRGPSPDFAARLREQFPKGVPGRPLSELVIASRGEY